MNPEQSQFRGFLMAMVAPGNEAAAETILANAFAEQDAGRFTPNVIVQAVEHLTPLLRPEAVPELQKAAARMEAIATHALAERHGDQGGDGGEQPMRVFEERPRVFEERPGTTPDAA